MKDQIGKLQGCGSIEAIATIMTTIKGCLFVRKFIDVQRKHFLFLSYMMILYVWEVRLIPFCPTRGRKIMSTSISLGLGSADYVDQTAQFDSEFSDCYRSGVNQHVIFEKAPGYMRLKQPTLSLSLRYSSARAHGTTSDFNIWTIQSTFSL